VQGQNLVKNPGFEEYDQVAYFKYRYEPYDSTFVRKHWYKRNRLYVRDTADSVLICKYWYRAQESFPDYFNKNISDHYSPRAGSAYTGFIPFDLEDGCEPIAGEFTASLEAGKRYEISFFYCFAHTASSFYLDKIEAYISTDNWITRICSFGPPLSYRGMVTKDEYCHHCNDSTITDSITPTSVIAANVTFETPLVNDGQWHKMTGYYQAKGGEKYISFGIFYQNEKLFEIMNEYNHYEFAWGRNQKKLEKFYKKYRNDLFIHRNPQYIPNPDYRHREEYTCYFMDDVSIMVIP
jgi:hypothetical protein